MKEIVILAGPNGAGKTTAARVLLRDYLDSSLLVNADEIARGVTSRNPDISAGRLMLRRIDFLVQTGTSFAFETTCSGKSYVPLLRRCAQTGWRIALIFLWLPSPEFAVARVANRVINGGHAIPEDVIRRRFYVGVKNMRELYLPLAHEARIYDNSVQPRILIAEKRHSLNLVIQDAVRWAKIMETGEP